MKLDYHNIPISICLYTKENKCVKQFRLYFWLKLNCSGHFKMTNQLRYQTIRNLKITRETLNRQMDWLLRHKWVTYNSKSKNYRVNGFKLIHGKTGLPYKSGIVWDNFDIANFEAFVDAAILTYHGYRKRYFDRINIDHKKSKNVSGVNFGRTQKRDIASCYNLPVKYLAKNLRISVASIVKMKLKASKAGFINIKKQFENVNLSIENIEFYRKYGSESHKIVKKNKEVCIQQPDLFNSRLFLKLKSNLKQIKPKIVKRNIWGI